MKKQRQNPAARLHRLLLQAKQQPGTLRTRDVWSKTLGVPDQDQRGFLIEYTHLLMLYQEASVALKQVDGLDEDLFFAWEGPIARILDIGNHHQAWSSLAPQISGEVLQALAFAADRLESHCSEDAIPQVQLDDLLKRVEALEKQVVDSKLDPDVRLLLVQQLEYIKYALTAYKIRGAIVVKEALERSFGAVVLRANDFRKHNQPAVQGFMKLLFKLLEVASTAMRMKEQLLDPVRKFIGASDD